MQITEFAFFMQTQLQKNGIFSFCRIVQMEGAQLLLSPGAAWGLTGFIHADQ